MTVPDAAVRKRVYDLVWEYPGIHMRQVQRLTGADLSLVEYHLNQLEAQRAVVSVEQGGYRRFFPLASAGAPLGPDDHRLLGVLRQEHPFAIAMLLMEKGTMQHKDIAAALGLPKSVLSYHLGKMVRAGLLCKTSRGEARGFQLQDPDRVRRVLQHYRPTPDLVDAYGALWDGAYGRAGHGGDRGGSA